MKNLIFLLTLLALCSLPAHAARIQKQGFKTLAQCISSGATGATCLLGDEQVWDSTNAQQLSVSIATGALSGSGVTNYATNPGAEANATGCNAYDNASGATPTTGTGGSPTVTCTRTTSSPMVGNGSFLFSKPASNVQGQGISFNFSIDSGFKGQTIAIGGVYQIASGTFASGVSSDLQMFIYDVTNAALIPADTVVIVESGKFITSFKAASNSTSYRFILHQATTSALAYTFKFDSLKFTPYYNTISIQKQACAAPLSVTTTGTNPTKGTGNLIDECYIQRVGNTAIVESIMGWATAGAIGSGSDYFWNMPTIDGYALNVDSTRTHFPSGSPPLANSQESVCGLVNAYVNTSVGNQLAPYISNATQFRVAQYGSLNLFVGAASGHLTFNQNNYFMRIITCPIPIVGWSSIAPI